MKSRLAIIGHFAAGRAPGGAADRAERRDVAVPAAGAQRVGKSVQQAFVGHLREECASRL